MNSDATTTITDPDEVAWVTRQRQIVINYLASQRCEHNGVSLEPRWFISPYVAVWAIRSKTNPNRVGWWAISGDLPTDYITAADRNSTGDVLISFAKQWRDASERMQHGEQLNGNNVGDPTHAIELAPLLRSRADLLQQFGDELKASESAGK